MVNEENPFAGALKKKKKWPPDPVGEETPAPAPAPVPARPKKPWKPPGEQAKAADDGLIKSGINVLEKVVGRDLDGDTDVGKKGRIRG